MPACLRPLVPVLLALAIAPLVWSQPPNEPVEPAREPAREEPREPVREAPREEPREPAREPANEPRETPRMQSGRVDKVIDGDTLEVILGKRRVRVHVNGVDAPEPRQPWGPQARTALEQLVLGQSVDLLPVGSTRGTNLTAVVFVGEAEVGAALVAGGNAWADRHAMRPSDAGLCEVEANAREQRQGLWSLPLTQRVAPWEYRHGFLHRSHTDYSRETADNCRAAALGRRAKRVAGAAQ